MRFDLHIHSNRSLDGSAEPEDIVRHCKRIGLSGLAITDHNSIEGSLMAVECAKEEGLIAVSGVEVSSADGHVLAYGVESLPERGLPMDETVDRIRALGGIAVAAHPWRFPSGMGRDMVMTGAFDAIEVLNGGNSARENRRAREAARLRGLPFTAGSDAHKITEVGRCYLVLEAVTGGDDLIRAIKDGEAEVGGRSRNARETVVYAFETLYEWLGRGMKRV